MKKTSRSIVTLFGVCAVLWTARAIVDVFNQIYNESIFLFVLDCFCALIWIAAFIGSLKKYRSYQERAAKQNPAQNDADGILPDQEN